MPGAVGRQCKEKDINLKVALRVGKLISENFDDVTVIYTRKSDETVELYKRAEIANKNKADLFISIHCNAVENRKVTGVETLVMGVEQSEASIAIAKKENADILLEKDYQANYSGFDPNSSEAYIVFSLYSSVYLNKSTILASKIQNHLITNTKMVDRTVKQAALFVLYRVAMPSILVELGFISNAEEEKYLLREDTQELLAVSIYNAFVEYKNLFEGTLKPYLPVPKSTKTSPAVEVPEPTQIETPPQVKDSIQVEEKMIEAEPTIASEPLVAPANDVRFRIQFFISKGDLNTSDKKFSSLPTVKKYKENGIWKYTSGDYKTVAEAQEKLKDVRKQYADAFIIAFNNEQKITLTEAEKLLK
jgi:N-acetylmuramoyl-L-alanine amidase